MDEFNGEIYDYESQHLPKKISDHKEIECVFSQLLALKLNIMRTNIKLLQEVNQNFNSFGLLFPF